MRNAPSVMYPVGRSAVYGQVLAVCGALAALALVLLGWLHAQLPSALFAAGWLLWMVWSAVAFWSWRRQPVGQLQWDARATGQHTERQGVWRLMLQGAPPRELQRLRWALDAQTVLLLRLQAPGQRAVWVWLQAGDDPSCWDDLRRALKAQA